MHPDFVSPLHSQRSEEVGMTTSHLMFEGAGHRVLRHCPEAPSGEVRPACLGGRPVHGSIGPTAALGICTQVIFQGGFL